MKKLSLLMLIGYANVYSAALPWPEINGADDFTAYCDRPVNAKIAELTHGINLDEYFNVESENGELIKLNNPSKILKLIINDTRNKQYENDPQIIHYLLEEGANPNVRNTKTSQSLLHKVTNPDIAKLLIQHGANVNASLESPDALYKIDLIPTPLDCARKKGLTEVVEVLLNAGGETARTRSLTETLKRIKPTAQKTKSDYSDDDSDDEATEAKS